MPSRFATQMAWFHDALMGKRPLPVNSADARRTLEIVTAFYASSRTHQDIHFPIGADHPDYDRGWLPEGSA